jgi:hypothetical protein
MFCSASLILAFLVCLLAAAVGAQGFPAFDAHIHYDWLGRSVAHRETSGPKVSFFPP